MSIHHENMNQQITKEQVDRILTQETRVARNMEKDTQGYDRQFYSVEQTRQDMKLINQALYFPPLDLRLEDSKKYRLQAIQGRNLAHVLLNSTKYSGDSKEMKNVKNSIELLEQKLAEVREGSPSLADIENVENAYMLAISNCRYYCDNKNPSFQTGMERKQLVMDTLTHLRREAGWLAQAKKRIQAGEQFQDIHTVRDLLEKGQENGENPAETSGEGSINALTYNDFVAVLGTHNRGQVEFSGGELKIINNGMLSRSKGEASGENYELRQRFFGIIMQRLGNELTPELFDRMRKILEIGDGADQALPLSRQAIHDVIALVNMRTSVVARTLHRGSKADPIQFALAKKANEIVGGKAIAYERSFASSEREKEFKKEINYVLSQARKQDQTIPELTTRQMDRLVRGNLSLMRDQIFVALEKCRAQITHLTGGRDNGLGMAEQGWSTDSLIAARAIHLVAASTEAGRALAEHQMEETIRKVAFMFVPPEMNTAYQNVRFSQLSSGGSNGLQEEVEVRLAKNSTLQNDLQKTRLGTEALKELCEKMQRLDEWQSKALHEGLLAEEAAQMVALGNEINSLTSQYRNKDQVEAMRFVAQQLEGTRFAEGFAALERANQTHTFSIYGEVRKLAEGMTCPREMLERERQQEALPEEEQEQMTTRNIRFELDMLEPEARKIASVLLLADSPSAFLNKKSRSQMKEYQQLHDTLRRFASAGGNCEETIRMAGVFFKLYQEDSQILKLEIDGKKLILSANAAIIADALETDVIGHEEVYGSQRLQEIIDGLEPDEENMADWIRSRKLCLKVLTQKTGKPSDFFNNVPARQVQNYASKLLAGRMTAAAVITNIEQIENKERINGDETLELLKMNAKMQEQERELGINGVRVHLPRREVRRQQTGAQDAREWSEEEESVKDLVSDLIFSQETWKADDTLEQPGMRVKLMLEKHVDTLVQIVRNPGLIDTLILRMSFPGEAEAQQSLRDMVHGAMEKILSLFVFKGAIDVMSDAQIRFAILAALQMQIVQGELTGIDAEINQTVEKNIGSMQAKISEAVGTVFGGTANDAQASALLDDTRVEDELKVVIEQLRPIYEKLKTVERKDLPEPEKNMLSDLEARRERLTQKSVGKLNKIMQQSAQGASGQGKFIRLVLENYFKEVPLMDQRAMFASALRNAKPHVEPEANATEEEKKAHEEQELGNYLSGILKGAGPLLQKMLQGLPLDAMPEMLKGALKDMKSNLAPIPDEIVQAQLRGMVERSHGKVTRMEVVRALGAASVGQAFMCRIYGPGMPAEGNEVVVKLLRPDVRNRMEREKEIMRKCADQTDENHGMLATYNGQLLRISEELDLSFEAQNVEAGKIYDKKTTTVQSMKVNPLIEPTVNALALEKAPGTTIDKYLDELHQMEEEMMKDLYVHNEDGSIKMVQKDTKTYPELHVEQENMYKVKMQRDKLAKKLEQLTKRQVYLADLAEQWVTEGIFGQGFYHGDLHAGNMLIDDDGLTVIDFGNATTLTEKQKTEVTRMVAAAAYGFADDFQNALHNLLEHTDEKFYQEKKKKLGDMLKKVFRMGNQESAGQRIAVALLKAQELGIEVPSSIFNFSQCQIRLQNALDEMNNLIDTMREDLDALNAVTEERTSAYVMHPVLENQKDRIIIPLADREKFLSDVDFSNNIAKNKFMSSYKTPLVGPKSIFGPIKDSFTVAAPAMLEQGRDDELLDVMLGCVSNIDMYVTIDEAAYVRDAIKDVVGKMIQKEDYAQPMQELFDYVKQLDARGGADIEEYVQALDSLEQATKTTNPNPPTPEQLAQLKENAYNAYCKAHEAYVLNYELAEVRGKLRNTDEDHVKKMDRTLAPMFQNVKDQGAKLQEAYTGLRQAQAQQLGQEQIREAEDKFLRLYHQVIVEDLTKVSNDSQLKSRPQTFFDAMGHVIANNMMASLVRLGTSANKYRKAMNNMI